MAPAEAAEVPATVLQPLVAHSVSDVATGAMMGARRTHCDVTSGGCGGSVDERVVKAVHLAGDLASMAEEIQRCVDGEAACHADVIAYGVGRNLRQRGREPEVRGGVGDAGVAGEASRGLREAETAQGPLKSVTSVVLQLRAEGRRRSAARAVNKLSNSVPKISNIAKKRSQGDMCLAGGCLSLSVHYGRCIRRLLSGSGESFAKSINSRRAG